MAARGADDRDAQELYSLFLPIDEELILLPDVAVVESAGMDPVHRVDDGPDWLIGLLPWRERQLPVISFEGLCGRPIPPRTRRSRVVIVNGPGRFLETGLFALLTQGHPQLIGINRRAIRPGSLRHTDSAQLVLARVNIGNRQPIIPDLEAIETLVADELNGSRDATV